MLNNFVTVLGVFYQAFIWLFTIEDTVGINDTPPLTASPGLSKFRRQMGRTLLNTERFRSGLRRLSLRTIYMFLHVRATHT